MAPAWNDTPPEALLIGRLQREYILPFNNPPRFNKLGGNLAYSAAGLALWGGKAGLISRVNAGFPLEELEPLSAINFDLSGIRVVPEPIDARFFVAWSDPQTAHYENPLTFFAERNLPFDRELLGYDPNPRRNCSKTDYKSDSFRITDIPRKFLEAPVAHINPIDFISHKILPSILKGGMIQLLSMRASTCYMDPVFWEEMRGLVSDLEVFMATEAQVFRLFQGRSVDLWEIAGILSGYGPKVVILHRPDGSAWLYDRPEGKRWIVPAYPSKVVDPHGSLGVFDGAFLWNYRQTEDPLEATLRGIVSASIAVEGSGPFYILDVFPGLKQARLESLRQMVHII